MNGIDSSENRIPQKMTVNHHVPPKKTTMFPLNINNQCGCITLFPFHKNSSILATEEPPEPSAPRSFDGTLQPKVERGAMAQFVLAQRFNLGW